MCWYSHVWLSKLVIVCMIDKCVCVYDRRAEEGYFIKMAVGVLTRQLIHRVSWQARDDINEHLDASKSKHAISVQPLNVRAYAHLYTHRQTYTHSSHTHSNTQTCPHTLTFLAASQSSDSDLSSRLMGMHIIIFKKSIYTRLNSEMEKHNSRLCSRYTNECGNRQCMLDPMSHKSVALTSESIWYINSKRKCQNTSFEETLPK